MAAKMCSGLKNFEALLSPDTYKPDKALQEKALLELRETPQNIQNGLKELKILLADEKDLTVPIDNDEWLLMFLRKFKFYPNSTRDMIKRYYEIRLKYSEVTTLLLPSKLKCAFDNDIVSFLPQRDQHGRRIILIMGGAQWDPKVVLREEMFSSSVLCTDLLQKDYESQINGVVYLVDLNGLTFSTLLQYTLYYTKRCLDFIQEGTPLRVKGFHIINQPKIFQPIFAAVKQYFSPKFRNRILMHGNNYASLHQYISPECLPKCYGGTLDSTLMHSRETYQLLAEHEELFKHLQGFGYKNS